MPETTEKSPKKPNGRPTKYTPAVFEEILVRLTEGEPLRQICRDEHIPAWRTIYSWLAADKDLSARFAHARDLGMDAIFEDALAIADNPLYGFKTTESDKGSYVTREDMLGHRKLQIETRFKMLSKWNPKKYGDKQIISGDADSPLEIKQSSELLDAILLNLQLTKKAE
jgi:ethanolamine ammonia-lyase small subunit